MKLHPKCIDNNKPPALSATGYMLPCCWCDTADFRGFESLMKDHLHLDNVNDVRNEIILSEEWDNFFYTLIENPKAAPSVCRRKCATPKELKRKHRDINSL